MTYRRYTMFFRNVPYVIMRCRQEDVEKFLRDRPDLGPWGGAQSPAGTGELQPERRLLAQGRFSCAAMHVPSNVFSFRSQSSQKQSWQSGRRRVFRF